jgi:FG-GAP-like repeat
MVVGAATASAAIRFASPMQLATGSAWMVAAGDLNGDGKSDIVAVNPVSLGPGGVSIEMNTTPKGSMQASFRRCPSLRTNGASPQALALADLTGDGKLDLIVGNFFTDGGGPGFPAFPAGPGIQVFQNNTPPGAACPTFAAPVDIAAGVAPEVLAVGDFNGDGRPDLAFTDYGIPGLPQTQDVSVVMNEGVHNGRLEFSRRFSYDVGEQPLGVAAADVNGDGKPDLEVGNNFSANVSVLINRTPIGARDPLFSAPDSFAAGSRPLGPETLAVGDLTGKGKPDIVTPNFASDHGMSVLMNTTAKGADTPSFAPQATYDPGLGPQMIAIANFDGDGKPDIAVALQGTVGAGNQAVLNGGAVTILSSIPFLSNAAAGVGSGVVVYDNLTPTRAARPLLAPPLFFPAGNGSDAVAVADFNADGKPDLVVANNLTPGPAGVSVLMNATPWPAK